MLALFLYTKIVKSRKTRDKNLPIYNKDTVEEENVPG